MTLASPRGEVTIGIDIGTTSVKAVAADADGTILARARIPHALVIPSAARLEHDVAAAWIRGPRKALAAVRGHGERAVGLSAMVPSLTAVNARGRPLTPGLLYGDERGHRAGGGSPASSGEGFEFLRWTAGAAAGARAYWPAQAVAAYALCKEGAVDFSVAGSFAPPFNYVEWDPAVLEPIGVQQSQLPRVVNFGESIGEVDGMAVSGGTVDFLAEQMVAGADEEGDVIVGCGTTLLPWAVITENREVPGLWAAPHMGAEGKILLGGASNAGGLFLNWATRLAAASRRDDSLAPERVPVWVPYVRGERTPYHDSSRRASLHDLDLTHGPLAMRRAAFEAAGFVARHHIELAGVAAKRIVATGGGTRVPEWMQALADCTGLPVDVVAVPEGAALGAAFQARMALGLEARIEDAARWARIGHRVEPDAAWLAPCAERYARFRELSDKMA